ncbi:MAG: hypothetical protein ACK5LZ_04605 [Anaerorhabdus sp.]
MKKKILMGLASLLLISGCTDSNNQEMNSSEYNQYTQTYEMINTQVAFLESSTNFSMNVEIAQDEEGKIIYYVVIDEATVAMQDVEAMVVAVGANAEVTMFPSIGIVDDATYNLVPAQVNKAEGYVEGFVLSGETEYQTELTLRVMVSWISSAKSDRVREFLEITIGTE